MFVDWIINIDMKCLFEFSIINLSDYSLNQIDLKLLNNGLTFTPMPQILAKSSAILIDFLEE